MNDIIRNWNYISDRWQGIKYTHKNMFRYFCAALAVDWLLDDSVKWITTVRRSRSDAIKSYCENANTELLCIKVEWSFEMNHFEVSINNISDSVWVTECHMFLR